MKTLTRNLKTHVLKILCSVVLLLVMIPRILAQEPLPDESPYIINKKDVSKTNADPEKSTPIRLNVVGSDALIYGLTVGRGGGGISTNVAFGFRTLDKNTGYFNTAIGSYALWSNTTGITNTALGAYTLKDNTTGYQNVAIGGSTLSYNISGHNNTAIGRRALYLNTSGYSNVAVGINALNSNTVSNNLVAVGDSTLFNNGLNTTQIWHATANTALGSKALYANTTGYNNTATGFRALYSNTIGRYNTATGWQALYENTTGNNNTATGMQALYSNITGSYNTAYGANALKDLFSGTHNTAIGYSAGDWTRSISYGTFVGYNAYPFAADFSNITGIGYGARPSASNQVHIGNTAVTSIRGNVDFTTFSDGNYKTSVEEEVAGLDFILRLRPVSYNLDVHKLAADLGEDMRRDEEGNKSMPTPDEITLKSRNDKASIRYTGFIAQEVEATVNELGVAFSGVDAPTNKESHYGLRYANFVVPLVKAVQEQQAQIEILKPAAVEALQIELQQSRAENATMQQELKEVKDKLDQVLALLMQQGIDLGGMDTNIPLRTEPNQSWSSNEGSSARLEQNTPNPFHENTLIRYLLPEGTHRAQIIITDMGGTQVMLLPLEHQGAGQVMIHGGTLPSGTYVYTLTIDGRKVDSKRMVLL